MAGWGRRGAGRKRVVQTRKEEFVWGQRQECCHSGQYTVDVVRGSDYRGYKGIYVA